MLEVFSGTVRLRRKRSAFSFQPSALALPANQPDSPAVTGDKPRTAQNRNTEETSRPAMKRSFSGTAIPGCVVPAANAGKKPHRQECLCHRRPIGNA